MKRGTQARRLRRWSLLPVMIACGALSLSGCATDPQTAPSAARSEADRDAGFEAPPVFRASELLPPEILESAHHRVSEEVTTDGFLRRYTISSKFGAFHALGDDAVRTRVREIRALAALDEMSKRKEFAIAAARALRSPLVATWNLIRHPVDSITGVPAEAWEILERTSRLARRERGELEDSAFREFIGFEAKKRELAYQLGVDPYSSNKALQRQLNRFAWAAFLGGIPGMFVPFADAPSPHVERRDPSATQRMKEILLDYSPEDLRRLNRIELAVMGISGSLSDAFIGHPWFSPRHQTLLVESLSGFDPTADRSAFIEVAVTADSEEAAHFHQRTAEILRLYNDRVARIESTVAIGGWAAGVVASRTLVVPVLIDHAAWTGVTAAFAESIARSAPAHLPVEKTELLISGTLSPRCRAEIEALGIAVTERALARLAAAGPEASGGAR